MKKYRVRPLSPLWWTGVVLGAFSIVGGVWSWMMLLGAVA